MEAEIPTLVFPRERNVGRSEEPSTGERWRLTTCGDRSDDVRREPAQPEKLPQVPLAVVGHNRVVLTGERPMLRQECMRNELKQDWVGIGGRIFQTQNQLQLVASPSQISRDLDTLIEVVPEAHDDP